MTRRAELVVQISTALAGQPLRLERLSLGSLLNILADLTTHKRKAP